MKNLKINNKEDFNNSPINQAINKSIIDIQIIAADLNQTSTDKLSTDLWDLEQKVV